MTQHSIAGIHEYGLGIKDFIKDVKSDVNADYRIGRIEKELKKNFLIITNSNRHKQFVEPKVNKRARRARKYLYMFLSGHDSGKPPFSINIFECVALSKLAFDLYKNHPFHSCFASIDVKHHMVMAEWLMYDFMMGGAVAELRLKIESLRNDVLSREFAISSSIEMIGNINSKENSYSVEDKNNLTKLNERRIEIGKSLVSKKKEEIDTLLKDLQSFLYGDSQHD